MKMNKFLSIIVVLSMIISMFSLVTVSAATLDDLAIDFAFINDKNGDADGTLTISGIDADLQAAITGINIYWGKNATEKLDNYYNIANYTVEGFTTANADFDATKLVYADNALTREFVNGRLIPEGATHVIAEVITADAAKVLSYAIPANKLFSADKSEMLYSMVWASDFHADNTSHSLNSHPNLGIADFVRLAAKGREAGADKFKGVIFNGDIANSAIDYEYALIEDMIADHGVDFPFYYLTGNHDTAMFSNGVSKWDEASKALDIRMNHLEEDFGIVIDRADPWSYEAYVGGHHYIFLSTPYRDSYSLSAAQAKWLEEKLCYSEKSGEPTFIFTHMPWASGGLTNTGSAFNDDVFNEIVKRHPSVIIVTGHVHSELDSDMICYNISDVAHTPILDTAAVTYTNAYPSTGSKVSGRGGYARYVEVYEDRIIMRTRRVRDQYWVAKGEHIIYVDDFDKKFNGTFTIDYDDTLMSAGEVLTAKLNGAALDTSAYSINWYDMNGALLQEGGATYTVTTANASVSAKVTTADGGYAWAVARYIAPVVDDGGDDGEGETPVHPSDNLEYNGPTTVKYSGDVVYLYGNLGSSNAGKEATMVLINKNDYPDMKKAKYFGTCPITSTGEYMFKFKASDVASGDIFLVKVDGVDVVANYVSSKGALEDIVEVAAVLDDDNKLSLSLFNKYADAMKAKIIVAAYDALTGQLSETKIVNYDLAFNEGGELQTWINDTEVAGGKNIKVFLWSSMTDIVPLSSEKDLGVSAVIETETPEAVTE